ncbi:MAG: decaprenyl-phosphate phosphoribosyltransferase [Ardenticatenales bacterium]|nr:decaprenyl-phosphate phosphoribosyltransferase [Ardenticatenales bacterium]
MQHETNRALTMPLEQLKALLETMRPKQWVKNAIVFGGLVFSERGLALHPDAILRAVAAFAIFCLMSSAAYILNDLKDIEKDRAHPTKRDRPLPSGRLSETTARIAFLLILALGLLSAYTLAPLFGAVALLYIANNFLYNWILKSMVILDVFSIAAGFVLRAVGGAVAVGVLISPWLYVLTVLLALFLGISKRRHELHLLEEGRGAFRKVLTEYSAPMLEEMLSVVTASTVIAYSIYTFTAESLPDNHAMMLTIPFVIYGIFRYLYLVHSENDAPPDEMLFKDRPMLITTFLWGVTVILILYGFGNRAAGV